MNSKLLTLVLASMLVACGGKKGRKDSQAPPLPPYEQIEIEPNNSFYNFQFLDILPLYPQETLLGSWLTNGIETSDYYWFFLNPSQGQQIFFNATVTTDQGRAPRMRLFQTVNGSQELLGTFQGVDGFVGLTEFPIQYEFNVREDLYVVIDSFGVGDSDYEFTYSTN